MAGAAGERLALFRLKPPLGGLSSSGPRIHASPTLNGLRSNTFRILLFAITD